MEEKRLLEICQAALDNYGFEAQKTMLIEEVGELLNSISKLSRNRSNEDDVLSELADVEIMVKQMALNFGYDKFKRSLEYKLNRLEDKLNKTSKCPFKRKKLLLCGIAGDIIGSVYEFKTERIKTKDFPLFSDYSKYTDDTVCSIAIMKWILNRKRDLDKIMRETCLSDLNRGYGDMFYSWLHDSSMGDYGSFGNGSAIRISPIGWSAFTLNEALYIAEESAMITHGHEEGIKGAKSVAACIFLARIGKTKEEIKDYVEKTFGYDLSRKLDDIRPNYKFDATCQGSVPESIICFLESNSFEDSIRNAVSLGGDTDTMAAIASSIAEAFYDDIPDYIYDKVIEMLPKSYLRVMENFTELTTNEIYSKMISSLNHCEPTDVYYLNCKATI